MPGLDLYPPFPDDVLTYPLPIIDYSLLEAGDKNEIERLWVAGKDLGFWYLKNFNQDHVDDMFQFGQDVMNLPVEEKLKVAQRDNGESFGYKHRGAIICDRNGTLESSEFYNVSQDDAFAYPGQVHRSYTENTNAVMESTIAPFIRTCVEVTNKMRDIFEKKLDLPEGTIAKLHDLKKPCMSEIRIVRTPGNQPSLGIGAHSDFGTIAIVHNKLGGLQVQIPGSEEWYYIKPLPGHAVCNVGDALSIFSGGILRSAIHRVDAPPGEQRKCTRISVCYFGRSNHEARLRHLGELSPAIAEALPRARLDCDPGRTMQSWVEGRVKTLKDATKALAHKSIEDSVGTLPVNEKTADRLSFLADSIQKNTLMA